MRDRNYELTIPAYDKFMLPALELLADVQERSLEDINNEMATEFSLSKADLNERNESTQTTFYNRVAWARTYLKKAGLVISTAAGRFKIAARGTKKRDHRSHRG